MCQSLHVAVSKCMPKLRCFVHLYLPFYYKNDVFLLFVNYDPSVFVGHEDTEPYIFRGSDLDLLGSRDVIKNVTIGLGMGTFL